MRDPPAKSNADQSQPPAISIVLVAAGQGKFEIAPGLPVPQAASDGLKAFAKALARAAARHAFAAPRDLP
jgi:hypothetical protein